MTTCIDTATTTTAVYTLPAKLRPSTTNKSVLEISLAAPEVVDGLKHRFMSIVPHHAHRPGLISVMRLLEACIHIPTGYDVSSDGSSLSVFFTEGTESDVLFAASYRLRARIDEICGSVDKKYKISALTHLIEAR